MGNAGHCAYCCGCLHGLRCADWQGSEEEARQKGVGGRRGSGICGRDSGGHSDCPDTDAALIRQEAFAMDKGRYQSSSKVHRRDRSSRQGTQIEMTICHITKAFVSFLLLLA